MSKMAPLPLLYALGTFGSGLSTFHSNFLFPKTNYSKFQKVYGLLSLFYAIGVVLAETCNWQWLIWFNVMNCGLTFLLGFFLFMVKPACKWYISDMFLAGISTVYFLIKWWSFSIMYYHSLFSSEGIICAPEALYLTHIKYAYLND